MDAHTAILGAALILISSFFFNILSKRTNVPSVLMLMVLGFGIQQFVGVEQASLLPYLEILGTVGVILIVLEASLDLHLTSSKRGLILQASTMALALLLASAGLIALILWAVLGLSGLTALIYAVPLSVLSSAIIIPSVSKLREYTKEFLIFESALSDILGIVVFYALLDFYKAGGTPDVVWQVGGKILLTILLSIVLSYVLIAVFQSVTESVRLTLLIAVLMGLYAAGKLLHLSPLILIMVFGLALNNKKLFFQGGLTHLVNDERFDKMLKDLHFITLEAAFVVRTFFFVAFGMSIVLDTLLHWSVPVITVLILVIIYGTRYLGLRIVSPAIMHPSLSVAPRGLITVLLFYGIPESLQAEAFQPGIILMTILTTSTIMTVGLIRNRKKPAKSAGTTEPTASSTPTAPPPAPAPTPEVSAPEAP